VTPGCSNLASWLRWFTPRFVAPWTKTNSMTRGVVAQWTCWEPILFFGEKWPRSRANDVFNFPVGEQKTESLGSLTPYHPCPKPLQFWADLVECYSEPGDLVVDAFAGSGTTLVACEQLGRPCCAMEHSPEYAAVALQRLADLGLTPRRVESA
jgi:DNA modification methylase